MSRKIVFDDDNPEWTEEDFRTARPGWELPPEILAAFPNTKRGPQVAPTKVQITLRLDRDVVERFRATGSGWQTRINEVLKKAV
ncbi:BrnA antitoxin family protein [Bosea sp. PAMC 26642]|uniref:BrnA antitoxin family protein n=1 Tax=Bosea sp. (strain PAMC 26642) TaxID=1792307 RepID=UPI00076FF092|nr:BrnA antitoxin family protein [Bosea sp. PAMC 26642]AMJ61681.1 hypothetical protein AXW83_16420 [Bosea sp. PAMC 26642]